MKVCKYSAPSTHMNIEGHGPLNIFDRTLNIDDIMIRIIVIYMKRKEGRPYIHKVEPRAARQGRGPCDEWRTQLRNYNRPIKRLFSDAFLSRLLLSLPAESTDWL